MRRRGFIRLLAVVLLGLALAWPPAIGQAGAEDEQGWIVTFQTGTAAAERVAAARAAGAAVRFSYTVIDAVAVRAGPGAIAALRRQGKVISVVPDRVVTALGWPDSSPDGRPVGGGGSAKQVIPAGVKRIGADGVWKSLTGAGVGVAVVDSGIDFSHPDLKPVATPCFTAYASCQDDYGHGTHVSGIIAARDNSLDVVGVAPGATLYAVKVLDQTGSGADSALIAGLDWVYANRDAVSPPIRVVNMSLGRDASSPTDDQPMRDAVARLYDAGISVVVSAGNEPRKTISDIVPAGFPEVMAVASTTAVDGANDCRWRSGPIQADTASNFTTDGTGVAISAPGEESESFGRLCLPSSSGILSTKLGGGTTRMSGTSMASPHVAGVVALMWEQAVKAGGSLAPETVRSKLRSSADRVGVAPLDSPTLLYSFDGIHEGIVSAPGATQ